MDEPMRKYTSIEGTPRVVSPEAHKAVEVELKKFAKTSARDLSDSQREQVRNSLDTSDTD